VRIAGLCRMRHRMPTPRCLGALTATACLMWVVPDVVASVGLQHPDGTAPGGSSLGCPLTASSPASPLAVAPADIYHPPASDLLVCVGAMPITGALFDHWFRVAQLSAHPAQHASQASLLKQVMGFLISADWVIGEASDQGVKVSDAEVKKQFSQIKQQQFPRRRDFQKFLKSSGQTVGDLMLRVRLNLLSADLQRRVAGHGNKRSKPRALNRFLHQFRQKWTARTYCQAPYKVSDCGHILSPSSPEATNPSSPPA
jgi:SurA N-terminal domain